MHEMEGPRRSCCPAVTDRSASTGLAGLLRVVPVPIARDRHAVERVLLAVLRSRSLGSSSFGKRVLPAVRRSRSLGSSSYVELLLAVRRSRSLGSGSYVERWPRRRCPDRSGPACTGLPYLAVP
jgi:hypothetical protein